MKKRLVRFPIWPKQAEFLDATAPIKGFVGGIGSGKTRIGAYDLLARTKPNRLYIATAPTYKVLRDATCRSFEEVARHCGLLLKPVGGESVSSTIRCMVGGKAEVLFRSTENPDLLRGPNASGVWMDEASLSPYEAFQNLTGRLREAGEAGWMTCTFTPKGRTHWTYSDVFGKDPPRTDVYLVRAGTAENPFLSEQFVTQVGANFSGLLASQELGGQFVSVEGAEWPPEYFDDLHWFDEFPSDMPVRVAALDPSKGRDAKSGDYAAFTLLGIDGDGTLWVEGDLRRGVSSEALADQVAEYQRVFKPHGFAVETNQFQQLLCVLIRLAAERQHILVPTVEVDNRVNKIVRVRRLGPYLATKRVRFRNTPGTRLLVDQLREFPEGQHDDGPDSFEMALRVASALLDSVNDGEVVFQA